VINIEQENELFKKSYVELLQLRFENPKEDFDDFSKKLNRIV
jgi:hypothetical protein